MCLLMETNACQAPELGWDLHYAVYRRFLINFFGGLYTFRVNVGINFSADY